MLVDDDVDNFYVEIDVDDIDVVDIDVVFDIIVVFCYGQ